MLTFGKCDGVCDRFMHSILTVLRFGTYNILDDCDAFRKRLIRIRVHFCQSSLAAKCLPIELADSTQFSHIPVISISKGETR